MGFAGLAVTGTSLRSEAPPNPLPDFILLPPNPAPAFDWKPLPWPLENPVVPKPEPMFVTVVPWRDPESPLEF